MAIRKASSLRGRTLVATVGLCLAMLGYGRAYAASPIRIHSPAPNSVVSEMVTTLVQIKPKVTRVAFLIDGKLMTSSSSTSFVWNSASFANGMHTIAASAYSSSSQLLRTVSEQVKVSNKHSRPTPTPTRTATSTPTKTPTPTATPTPAACVNIMAPAPNATVSGIVAINTNDLCTGVWFESLYVDGAHVADFPTGQVMFTSTSYAGGNHTIKVTSQSTNPGSVVLGIASETLNVQAGSPTATPTVTQTATPAATPTPTSTSTSSVSATPTATSTPSGATFYVSMSGNDSASGSSGAPWRTIQKAASTLLAGQTAIVSAGNYGERVEVSSSGTQSAPITLQVASGADVQLLGFDLTGSNWILNGFDISTQTNGSQGYGIHVDGSASNDTIENNYIHELCHEGIFMEPTVSYISILNNRFWRAEMAGAQVDGLNNLVEGNEVWGTQQYAMNAGGIYSGCTIGDGADADAFRFFGQHNVFRLNYMHDIVTDSGTNPNPHTDCFQTWGSSAMTVDDILIERNLCRWPQSSNSIVNEPANIEGLDGNVGTVTFQNNEFSNMRQGIFIGSNTSALHMYNNTYDHILQEAVIFNDTRSSADEIINNIFYDVGSGGDAYAEVPSGSPVFEDNDFYLPGGATVGTYPSIEPYLSLDPMFVNYGDSTGLGADFHLQSGSPLKGAGSTISTVTNDYYGTSRVGAAYSIGAAQ
jgi:Protein of unknown function (DUF1565)